MAEVGHDGRLVAGVGEEIAFEDDPCAIEDRQGEEIPLGEEHTGVLVGEELASRLDMNHGVELPHPTLVGREGGELDGGASLLTYEVIEFLHV